MQRGHRLHHFTYLHRQYQLHQLRHLRFYFLYLSELGFIRYLVPAGHRLDAREAVVLCSV